MRSLNGDGRLRVVDRPEQVPPRFWDPAYDTSRWPVAKVPHTWQSDFLDHPMFRNIPGEIWPEDPPKVPRDNPTGAYVRTFDLPRDDPLHRRVEGVRPQNVTVGAPGRGG